MGVKEYKYLCEALKTEIMTLRGDLKKSSLPIRVVTDKKVLAYMPQDAIKKDGEGGSETTSETKTESTSEQPQSQPTSSTKGNIQARKRNSLLHLDEEEMILKYCELRAKYDNLLEISSAKIKEMQEAKDTVMDSVNIHPVETSSKEDKELIRKYEEVVEEKDKVNFDLKAKIQELTNENEGNQTMIECNIADINSLTETIEKLGML